MGRDDPNARAEEMDIVVGEGIVLFEIQQAATMERQDETSDEIRLGFIPLTAIEVWVDKAYERRVWRHDHVEMLPPRQISRPIDRQAAAGSPASPMRRAGWTDWSSSPYPARRTNSTISAFDRKLRSSMMGVMPVAPGSVSR